MTAFSSRFGGNRFNRSRFNLPGWRQSSTSVFAITALFANGEDGIWYKRADLTTLFQDVAGTTPVTTASQTVALMNDKSGNDEDATQSNSSFRPQYQTAGLLYDGLDDRMVTTYKPTTAGTIIAKFNGSAASKVIAGSQPASDGRCFLALDASGRLAAGIGAQSTATIVAPYVTTGTELVTNGTFDADTTGWTAGSAATLSQVDGRLRISEPTGTGTAYQSFATTTGVTYNVIGDATNPVGAAPNPQIWIGTSANSSNIALISDSNNYEGQLEGQFVATGSLTFISLVHTGAAGYDFDNISVQELTDDRDLRDTTAIGAVTWDGSTVKLYLDGVEVYSAAQSGAVNTTVDMILGALNANGTAAAFWDGTIADKIILDRAMTPAEITNTTTLWSA